MAPIAVGDTLPAGVLQEKTDAGIKKIDIGEWAAGKKVIIVGVPGAFTPTCSSVHIPGFVEKYEELSKLADGIAVISVNDVFAMQAWGKTFPGSEGKILFLADTLATYTKALGFEIDLGDILGLRARRFSLFAVDKVVKVLHLEEGGDLTNSTAEEILKELTELTK
eukprot:TRINITY_DN24923_c0_g1_i1.p1 TRINITY_DN24923_c0_g1~~TRINITY_DN24923_c0_g1_i1.p1  ORF type:complete len:190 (+),score=46.25 TRINITY_DN24923_c0_g1_i1:75-572(+)